LRDDVKNKTARILLTGFIMSLAVPVLACSSGAEVTKYLTTTEVKTQVSPTTVTMTFTHEPSPPTVTIPHYVMTTVFVSEITTAPPPPPSTVFITTTVVKQGIAIRQINLPSAEIPAANTFNICLVVENVSAQDMECDVPVVIRQMGDEEEEIVLHAEFFIEKGATETVCTEFLKLPVGIYTVTAGELERELVIKEGGG